MRTNVVIDDDLMAKAMGYSGLPTKTEVLQRFRSDADFKAAQDALLRFPVFSIGGVELCIKIAQNYRELRRRGITVRKTIDCLIATFVIERGYSLLHSDRDFSPFKEQLGLSIIH